MYAIFNTDDWALEFTCDAESELDAVTKMMRNAPCDKGATANLYVIGVTRRHVDALIDFQASNGQGPWPIDMQPGTLFMREKIDAIKAKISNYLHFPC